MDPLLPVIAGHVARAALHDPARAAAARPRLEPRVALAGRRAERHRAAPSRHRGGPRLGRARTQHAREGRHRCLRGPCCGALEGGAIVGLTADIPKIARVCGQGIVTLAQLSGRPIVPVAIVTSRRIDFRSWDRASLGLPFGRSAVVIGEPIFVAAEARRRGPLRRRAAPCRTGSIGSTNRPTPWSAAAIPAPARATRSRPGTARAHEDAAAAAAVALPGRADAARTRRRAGPGVALAQGQGGAGRASASGAASRAGPARAGASPGCTARASARRSPSCRWSSA